MAGWKQKRMIFERMNLIGRNKKDGEKLDKSTKWDWGEIHFLHHDPDLAAFWNLQH